MSEIRYDEVLAYGPDSWKQYSQHNAMEIKGFSGDYRFLSNFLPGRYHL
jgi:hypothetical protein